jgi:hypothetical protein
LHFNPRNHGVAFQWNELQCEKSIADVNRNWYLINKSICLYLRDTHSTGIVYWRPVSFSILPTGTFTPVPVKDETLPVFPSLSTPDQVVGFVDAAHATDAKTRRSVTGYVLTFCGAAVSYRSKVQNTIATSSTEAEFIAAVTASKGVKYLRYILHELQCPQPLPTPMYCDNLAAIAMINASKPTARSRHIDIQHFAIQHWRNIGDIIFHHIAGIINPSDAMTKALGWVLHSRHIHRAMGHHPSPYLDIAIKHED